MDKGTAITALIIVSVTVAPFLLMNYRAGTKRRKLRTSLNKLATALNCSISRYDSWGNSIIGIDEQQSVLFSLQFGTDEKPLSVRIKDLQYCSLMHPMQALAAGQPHPATRNELGLDIVYKLKDKPGEFISFLPANQDLPYDRKELELAKKWCDIISRHISTHYN